MFFAWLSTLSLPIGPLALVCGTARGVCPRSEGSTAFLFHFPLSVLCHCLHNQLRGGGIARGRRAPGAGSPGRGAGGARAAGSMALGARSQQRRAGSAESGSRSNVSS